MLSFCLLSFKQSPVEPVVFYYSKVVILQKGSDNFAFDSKKVDTSAGNISLSGKFIKVGKHKCKLKCISNELVIAVGYDKTYIFCK
jgi:hypothetical protein